jgi:hypothetical protein
MGTMKQLMVVLIVGLLLFSVSAGIAQNTPGYPQMVYVAKMLKSDVKTVGIISATMTDKDVERGTRAGMGQNVAVVIARPKSAGEIATLYKRMVSEKKVQFILLTDPADELMTGLGFEFLREAALADGVGIIVVSEPLLAGGALACVINEGGQTRAVVNHKVATVLGISPAQGGETPLSYVGK